MKLSPEESLQVECAHFLSLMCPDVLFWHTPNENKLLSTLSPIRRMLLQKKMFLMGVRSGVPDLTIHWQAPSHWVHAGMVIQPLLPRTLYIELKAGKNRATDSQKEIAERLTSMGIPICLCRSFKEFLDVLRQHKVPMRSGIYAGEVIN